MALIMKRVHFGKFQSINFNKSCYLEETEAYTCAAVDPMPSSTSTAEEYLPSGAATCAP